MNLFTTFSLVLMLAMPVSATGTHAGDKTEAGLKPAKGKAGIQATTATAAGGTTQSSAGDSTTPASTTPSPVAAPAATGGNMTLDAYIQALTEAAALSKAEQTDIKTYYLEDGSRLGDILNSATLTPFQQDQQVEDLRNTRNAKIEALLREVNRQDAFLKTEAAYRVALTELAENGGLAPAGPTPNVPQPTATPPAQADKIQKP